MGFVGFLILACGIGVIIWVMTTDIDGDVDLPEEQNRQSSRSGVTAWQAAGGRSRPGE